MSKVNTQYDDELVAIPITLTGMEEDDWHQSAKFENTGGFAMGLEREVTVVHVASSRRRLAKLKVKG
jgi:hypothetical protein